MKNLTFDHPHLLLLFIVVVLVFYLGREKQYLGFSNSSLLDGVLVWRPILKILNSFLIIGGSLILIAFAGPKVPGERDLSYREGRDVLMLIDISGSMSSNWTFEGQEMTKLSAAKETAIKFVKSRGDKDRIGMYVFGDYPLGVWPLTFDKKVVAKRIQSSVVDDGISYSTNILPALEMSLVHFKELSKSPGRALIILTDGGDTGGFPVYQKARLIEGLQDMGIRVYWINLEEISNRNADLSDVVNATGGSIAQALDYSALEVAMDQIDRMETARIPIKKTGTYKDVSHVFVLAALFFVFLGYSGRKLWEA